MAFELDLIGWAWLPCRMDPLVSKSAQVIILSRMCEAPYLVVVSSMYFVFLCTCDIHTHQQNGLLVNQTGGREVDERCWKLEEMRRSVCVCVCGRGGSGVCLCSVKSPS